MGDTQHTLNQLAKVPDWAKAGASHSQIAKDHDDASFFGVAFTCAKAADTKVLTALKAAWDERGMDVPGEGMEGNFDGKPTGNEAEDARRKKFLETREEGEFVEEEGHAPRPGRRAEARRRRRRASRRSSLLDPVLDTVLSGLAWTLRNSEDFNELEAELQATRERWETEARSGHARRRDHGPRSTRRSARQPA